MSIWAAVPEASLPVGAMDLNTYRPDEVQCVKGHRFLSEADCVLPEDWDYFLCRRCVEEISCAHDWQPYWDGSLGYTATDSCTGCHAYRPTPRETP